MLSLFGNGSEIRTCHHELFSVSLEEVDRMMQKAKGRHWNQKDQFQTLDPSFSAVTLYKPQPLHFPLSKMGVILFLSHDPGAVAEAQPWRLQ